MRRIKLMADYDCYPLWEMDDVGNIDPNDLPISDELRSKLKAWAEEFNAILCREDPSSTAFPSVEAEAAFETAGLSLRSELQYELGNEFEIHYFSIMVGRVLTENEIKNGE